MRITILVFLLIVSNHGRASGTDNTGFLINPATQELTDRGIFVTFVATAQVAEISCAMKDQVKDALERSSQFHMNLDLNNKQDFADVLFLTTQILGGVKQTGVTRWCANYALAHKKMFGR